MLDYLPLFLTWLLYGFIHSLTAASPVKQRLMGMYSWMPRYYRLFYNGLSLLSFLPVLLTYRAAPGENISAWEGSGTLGVILISFGSLLGVIALMGYDLVEFTGFPPRQPVVKTETLRQQGLLRYVRHPLYLATLVILLGLFVREPAWRTLLFGVFAFLYLRIGIYFEEQKLRVIFGQQYRDYQRQVPMLLPGRKKRKRHTDTPSS